MLRLTLMSTTEVSRCNGTKLSYPGSMTLEAPPCLESVSYIPNTGRKQRIPCRRPPLLTQRDAQVSPGLASGAARRPVGATCGDALTKRVFSGRGTASVVCLRQAA